MSATRLSDDTEEKINLARDMLCEQYPELREMMLSKNYIINRALEYYLK